MPGGAPYRKIALTAAVLWTAAIFVLCLWPGKELPHSDIPFIDKWTHFLLFGVFSLLWLWAYPPLPNTGLAQFRRISFLAIGLGCLVEGLQSAIPYLGRSGDFLDAVADAVGGILGALAFWAIRPARSGTGENHKA
jgi:VanZ family protein